MLRVTVDMFSGRPNPSWEVTGSHAARLLTAIAESRAALTAVHEGFDGLGVRGVIVELRDPDAAARHSLPSRFRVGGGGSQDEPGALSLAARLLATSPELSAEQQAEVRAGLVTAQEASRQRPRPEPPAPDATVDAFGPADAPPPPPTTITDGSCKVEVGRLNLPFWNSRPLWLKDNNCYAYGSNRRTNTFPQPGRAAGRPIASRTLAATIAAALADGAIRQTSCQASAQSPRWLMALVTFPDNAWNWDYHWYRKQVGGVWGHKPGETVANDHDNAGAIITDPQTAARGGYTTWGGYFYAPKSMVIE
jgi:hypothetical protein